MFDINQIMQELKNGDKQQRLEAIKALYQSKDPKAVKVLQWVARNDADEQLRTAASRAASRLQENRRNAEVKREESEKSSAASPAKQRIDAATSQLLDELTSDDEPAPKVYVSEESFKRKRKRVEAQASNSHKISGWDMVFALVMAIASVFIIGAVGGKWILVGNLQLSNNETFGSKILEYQNILREYLPFDYYLNNIEKDFTGFDVFTIANGTDAPYEAIFFSVDDEYLHTLSNAGIELSRQSFASPIDMFIITPAIISLLTMIIMIVSVMIVLSRFTEGSGFTVFAISPLLGLLSPLVRIFGATIFWVINLIIILINACFLLAFRFIGAERFIAESIRVMQLDVQPYSVGSLIGVGYWQTWLLMIVLFAICCAALGMKYLPEDEASREKQKYDG